MPAAALGSGRRRRPRAYDDALRQALGVGDEPVVLGEVVGVEHEFRVLRGAEQVPFLQLLVGLELGQRRLEPSDPNACTLESGTALTCDGDEAEIAIAPVPVGPGFARKAAWRAAADGARLGSTLPADLRLSGYSTHLSVATPPSVDEQVATVVASRFAVPLMLLMDRAHSPGLLVRPRPGRTEIGGEYVAGDRLAAALCFALGAVRWGIARAQRGTEAFPAVRTTVVADPERFGWYVDRRAFGADLYSGGRDAQVNWGGRTVRAQHVLQAAWEETRPLVAGDADPAELAAVDDAVSGDAPLPLEDDDPPDLSCGHPTPARPVSLGPSPYLRPLRRRHGGIELAPVVVTWDFVVFVVVDRRRLHRCFVTVPRPLLRVFATSVASGRLDAVLAARLRVDGKGTTLTCRRDALVPSFFDHLGRRSDLLAPERDPSEQGPFEAA